MAKRSPHRLLLAVDGGFRATESRSLDVEKANATRSVLRVGASLLNQRVGAVVDDHLPVHSFKGDLLRVAAEHLQDVRIIDQALTARDKEEGTNPLRPDSFRRHQIFPSCQRQIDRRKKEANAPKWYVHAPQTGEGRSAFTLARLSSRYSEWGPGARSLRALVRPRVLRVALLHRAT